MADAVCTNDKESQTLLSFMKPAKKRENYLEWDEYFMAVAFLSSKCSEDKSTKVGACIVNEDKKILGIGFNSMPRGCEAIPWVNSGEVPPPFESAFPLQEKYYYVCYAAKNAVLNSYQTDLKNCSLYTSVFPSYECAKILTQAHIKEVIYFSDKYGIKDETEASKRLLRRAHIKFREYVSTPPRTELTVKFTDTFPLNEQSQQHPNRRVVPQTTLKWDETFFMALAFLSAQRSKDPDFQVGAVIVDKNDKIVGIGYNSMPVGCHDDDMPWSKGELKTENKHSYVCHAELNAVMNRNCASLKGCRIFQTLYPCNECTKILIQSEIEEIIYYCKKKDHDGKPEFFTSTQMLEEDHSRDERRHNCKIRKYTGSEDPITIDFDEINDFDEIEQQSQSDQAQGGPSTLDQN